MCAAPKLVSSSPRGSPALRSLGRRFAGSVPLWLLDPKTSTPGVAVRSLAESFACALLFSFLISTFQIGWAQSATPPHLPSPVPGPMAQAARDYAWRPARVDVLPQTQGMREGEEIPVRVVL